MFEEVDFLGKRSEKNKDPTISQKTSNELSSSLDIQVHPSTIKPFKKWNGKVQTSIFYY